MPRTIEKKNIDRDPADTSEVTESTEDISSGKTSVSSPGVNVPRCEVVEGETSVFSQEADAAKREGAEGETSVSSQEADAAKREGAEGGTSVSSQEADVAKCEGAEGGTSVSSQEADVAKCEGAEEETSVSSQGVDVWKLRSADGKIFLLEEKFAKMFQFPDETIKQNIENDQPIPVEKIDSNTLTLMIEWAKQQDDEPQENYDDDDEDEIKGHYINEKDNEFLKDFDMITLFRLTEASNLVNMQGLLQVLLKKIASMIKGKTPNEIREIFNLLPPDEEN